MSKSVLASGVAAGLLVFAASAGAQDQAEPAEETEAAAQEATPAEDAAEASEDAAVDDEGDAEEGDEAGAENSEETAAGEVDPEILALLEAGDAEAGRARYNLCLACHVLDTNMNRVGPSLHGIIGRTAGTVEGFRYSPANQDSHVTWTEQNLFVYLENPREFIPGTIMAFPGMPDPQQRADLIAYMRENGGLLEQEAEGE